MRRYWLVIVLVLVVGLPLMGWAQPNVTRGEAWTQAKEGHEAIAAGDFDQAVQKFTNAHNLEPKIAEFEIGLANAWFFKEDYKRSMGHCRPFMSGRGARADAFQVYGNCLDAMGKPYEALETYRKGLKLFPESGILYLEMGIVEEGRNRGPEALAYWESGISVQPTLSSNYYFAAQQLYAMGDYAWAAAYAELFINLERNGERVREMSKVLMHSHEAARIFDYAGSYHWQWFQPKGGNMETVTEVHKALDEGYGSALLDTTRQLSIARLSETRRYVCHWLPTHFPDNALKGLHEWHMILVRQGIWEAYNYWLLYDSREKEFVDWLAGHPKEYADFEAWFLNNTFHRHVKRPVLRSSTLKKNR